MKSKKKLLPLFLIAGLYLGFADDESLKSKASEEVQIDAEKELASLSELSKSYEYEKDGSYKKIVKNYPLRF